MVLDIKRSTSSDKEKPIKDGNSQFYVVDFANLRNIISAGSALVEVLVILGNDNGIYVCVDFDDRAFQHDKQAYAANRNADKKTGF